MTIARSGTLPQVGSNTVLPRAQTGRNRKMPTDLHTVESALAPRIEAQAEALRLVLAHGQMPGFRLLRALVEDMDAWARELRAEPSDMAALVRRAAA